MLALWLLLRSHPQRKTFGAMTEEATDYLAAGVSRVWVVDPRAKSITVFFPDAPPRTYTGETILTDTLLPGLELVARRGFRSSDLPHPNNPHPNN